MVVNILVQVFSGRAVPRGDFSQWPPAMLWTYLLSEAMIALVFFSISLALARLVSKRVKSRYKQVFSLFALLTLGGACTHALALHLVWSPDYRFGVFSAAFTAAVSLIIAVMLWPQLAKAARLPGSAVLQQTIDQLEHEIAERRNVEEALRQSQATLRELAAYQENIREDERKRIAREIHDELGQNLLALRLDVAMLHERAGKRHSRLQQRAAGALDHIDATMKSIRAIMNNLRPSVLDLGLQAAIEWQVRQFERRNGVPCELMMSDEGARISDTEATAVFRILQESLTNIGRHAHATYVRIELRIDDRRLTMAIKDNGIGMYPGDRRKIRRYGLIGIQERVTMLGGALDIESSPGKGTVLRLSIPVHATGREMAPT